MKHHMARPGDNRHESNGKVTRENPSLWKFSAFPNPTSCPKPLVYMKPYRRNLVIEFAKWFFIFDYWYPEASLLVLGESHNQIRHGEFYWPRGSSNWLDLLFPDTSEILAGTRTMRTNSDSYNCHCEYHSAKLVKLLSTQVIRDSSGYTQASTWLPRSSRKNCFEFVHSWLIEMNTGQQSRQKVV